jgi:hypothetical protein
MIAVLPYYYNYYALVVNKEIVFMGKEGRLIDYSIEHTHTRYFKGTFKREDVCEVLCIFEQKLV